MDKERPKFERLPLGKYPKRVKISSSEMHFAYRHRQATGEPINTWVRRLIREAYAEELKAQRDQVRETDYLTPR